MDGASPEGGAARAGARPLTGIYIERAFIEAPPAALFRKSDVSKAVTPKGVEVKLRPFDLAHQTQLNQK